jgi:hypothetical protein
MADLFGQSQGFGLRQSQRDLIAQAEWNLDPQRLLSQFNTLRGGLGGLFGQIANQQGVIAQSAANTARAGLSRAGLGSTGLGASLSAGLTQGGAFAASNIRSRLLQDLLQTAERQRQQNAAGLFAAANAVPSVPGGQFSVGGQLLASGLGTAVGSIPMSFGGGSGSTPTAPPVAL